MLTVVVAVVFLGCQAGIIESPALVDVQEHEDWLEGDGSEQLDCSDYLSTREERMVVEAAADIGDLYLSGYIDAVERDWRLDAALWQVVGWDSARRLGVAKALASQVNEAMAAEMVLPIALGWDYGLEPSAEQRRVVAGLGIDDGDLDRYLDQTAALFEPFARALESHGALFTGDGWDLGEASFRPAELDGDPATFTALALFFSPAVASSVADPERTEAVVTRRVVFPPADDEGIVRAWDRPVWEELVASRLDAFARELDGFIDSSREAASYSNLMRGRLWELFGFERGHNGQTAPEIDRDSCYRAMRAHLEGLRRLGAHRELIGRLYQVTQAALRIDQDNLEAGIGRLNLAFGAALAAPVVPVLMYLAPIAGSWLGPTVALATADATATLALIPFAFALGSSAIHATIDAVHNGGGFSCYFVDELFHRSLGALYTAPFLAALPIAAVTGGGLAGLATGSQTVAVTSWGVINLGVATGFVAQFARSGVTNAVECHRLLEQASEAAESGAGAELVDGLISEAWHRCADAGIDLTFAAAGGRSLARSAYRTLAQRRAGSTELALLRRDTSEPLPADYYERLGVARDASSAEIQRAYRSRAMETHPDHGGSAAEFKALTEAYQQLSDPAARVLYDHFIGLRDLPQSDGMRPSASEVLGRPLSAETQAAVEAAHRVGWNDIGQDGVRPAGYGNYRPLHIFIKTRILSDAGLSFPEIRALMEAGVVGRAASELPPATARDAAHNAIATDLYNGRVVDARSFSANGNQTQVFWARLHNPRSGRSRQALFKPRPYGDGDGWNRTPGEYVAYAVNRLLGMDYVPPVAYRRNIDVNWEHHSEGAFLYLVPEVRNLSEVARRDWGVDPQLFLSDTRVLDVLLQNPDRHLGNFLFGRHWVDGQFRPLLIDHAAALRPSASVRLDQPGAFGPDPIVVVRRRTLDALRALNFDRLKSTIGEFVSNSEIRGILARRDGIVQYFENLAAERGENVVIIDVD